MNRIKNNDYAYWLCFSVILAVSIITKSVSAQEIPSAEQLHHDCQLLNQKEPTILGPYFLQNIERQYGYQPRQLSGIQQIGTQNWKWPKYTHVPIIVSDYCKIAHDQNSKEAIITQLNINEKNITEANINSMPSGNQGEQK